MKYLGRISDKVLSSSCLRLGAFESEDNRKDGYINFQMDQNPTKVTMIFRPLKDNFHRSLVWGRTGKKTTQWYCHHFFFFPPFVFFELPPAEELGADSCFFVLPWCLGTSSAIWIISCFSVMWRRVSKIQLHKYTPYKDQILGSA